MSHVYGRPSLLIVGYYHLADGFRTSANYLSKDYNIYFFPFCHYIDSKFNIKSELIKYIKGERCEHYECGLQENNPPIDVVLFWNYKYFIESHEGLNLFVMMKEEIKHKVIYLGYNWDPLPPMSEIDILKLSFIRMLNGYLSCDGREIKYLKEHGEYNYVYCPPGFDPQVTYYVYDPTYECDVSIVCTNLYEDYNIFARNMLGSIVKKWLTYYMHIVMKLNSIFMGQKNSRINIQSVIKAMFHMESALKYLRTAKLTCVSMRHPTIIIKNTSILVRDCHKF